MKALFTVRSNISQPSLKNISSDDTFKAYGLFTKGGGGWKMLTIADKGGRGARQMLTMDDTGGRGGRENADIG